MELEKLGKVVETDVLIVGGGPSGLWTASKARKFVDSVTMVEKGPNIGSTNQGYFSGGGMIACPPEDAEKFVEELVYFEDGLCDQELVEKVALQSYDRLHDLERMGVEFIRDASGNYRAVPQRGLKYVRTHLGKPMGSGGKKQIQVLVDEAKRLGVRMMNHIFINDLLLHDGKVNGAVGFDSRSGEFYIFKAKAVVLAVGNCNLGGHYQDMGMSTGEGIGMALRAGAEAQNMEFVTMWIVPRLFGWEGVTYLLPLGARFVTADGEPFVDRYSPVYKSNCDYNYLTKFMALEAREGRGPFYLDCSQMKPEDKELMHPHGGTWMDLQFPRLKEIGVDFFNKPSEWMPGFQGTSGGAIKTNHKMETGVPGLYIAGRLRSTDDGVYLGGWSLCTCAAYGTWAGENAAKYAGKSKQLSLDKDMVSHFKSQMYAPLGKAGLEPEAVMRQVQDAIFPAEVIILKNGKNLAKALKKIEEIRKEMVPQMGARDIHYLRKAMEVKDNALVAEMMLRASVMRTESRAAHYREDYPNRDNENWLRWLIIGMKDGKLTFRKEPVPLDRYKFKPTRYYMDNFKLPK